MNQKIFPKFVMGWAEGQVRADPGARTPIGTSGIVIQYFLPVCPHFLHTLGVGVQCLKRPGEDPHRHKRRFDLKLTNQMLINTIRDSWYAYCCDIDIQLINEPFIIYG